MIDAEVFDNNVGIEPLPVSTIFITNPNKFPILFFWYSEPDVVDVNGVLPLILTLADVFVFNVCKDAVPLLITLITLPNDELTLAVCALYTPLPVIWFIEEMCNKVDSSFSNPYWKLFANESGKEAEPQ